MAFGNTDLQQIYDALQILNNLDLLVQNVGNVQSKVFTIETIAAFELELDAWLSDANNANFILIEEQYIQDSAGTTAYLILYK